MVGEGKYGLRPERFRAGQSGRGKAVEQVGEREQLIVA